MLNHRAQVPKKAKEGADIAPVGICERPRNEGEVATVNEAVRIDYINCVVVKNVVCHARIVARILGFFYRNRQISSVICRLILKMKFFGATYKNTAINFEKLENF